MLHMDVSYCLLWFRSSEIVVCMLIPLQSTVVLGTWCDWTCTSIRKARPAASW